MNRATIVYIVDEVAQSVLLAKKTRKVGVGYRFGYGGKIELGEQEEESCCREVKDESGGLEIFPKDLQRAALIDFYKGADVPFGEPTFRVLCYRTNRWQGTPSSTEEMDDPQWFPISSLPTLDENGELKPGDILFVPHIIAGAPMKGWIRFSDDSKEVLGSNIVACNIEDLVI